MLDSFVHLAYSEQLIAEQQVLIRAKIVMAGLDGKFVDLCQEDLLFKVKPSRIEDAVGFG